MDIIQNKQNIPFLGFGLGLRSIYYEDILTKQHTVDWFEALTENYLISGGKPLYYLDKIRQDYPVVLHGVSLSLGSTDPLDYEYLNQLKTLAQRVEPMWISDHLCWTGVHGFNVHDLMPLPYTQETVNHVVNRIQSIQEYLGRPILIENVSSYLGYKESELQEWDFIAEIVKQSGCLVLLDVNNIYVSSVNHQFDPMEYIKAMPLNSVAQIHLAGHSNHGTHIIDTHDTPVVQAVWGLYAATLDHLGPVSTMIERDDNMPLFTELVQELDYARRIAAEVLEKAAA